MKVSPLLRRAQAGFTLLELLVVLLIIALLAGYVGPKLFSQVGAAKAKTAMSQMKSLADALDNYRLNVGQYPTTEQGLNALVKAPAEGASKWAGPYLAKDVPADPWDRPYIYHRPGENGKDYDLLTLGADGKPGGDGEDKDIIYN
ncbi:general secretion pathway protein G [Andreprevotia lacus DSM 23236]|jgi:general secretion pathway protein G|uniref:Type II secretion system core protein G n=1 Tax=Andreprevotia lacus DSM 23236 TaxID=1121001 RepID=A0A1W1WXW1_9NEIS|nr:type II secretion system major pseudopilin GspG [Andreprevotia lacus]SMC16576.1 general secretion pathway protein G [Andreprevotia lacus DSM 23236]